jgi:glycosyltransferase involved in cell wall biosynthesis
LGVKKNIAILHFAGPPVVGGVEKVMYEHAQLMAAAGHCVTIVAGEGRQVDDRIKFVRIPLAHSRHAEVLAAKRVLDSGKIPKAFESLVDRLYTSLLKTFEDVDVCFVHNVLTMTKNLALVAAFQRVAVETSLNVVAWHHDIAAGSERYGNEVHEGYPWNLVSERWTDVPLVHVTVSAARKAELVALFGMPEDDIRVIPSGVSLQSFFKLEAQTRHLVDLLNLEAVNPLLLLPMRITRRKNIQLALRIAAALKKHFPAASLVVTGPPGAHNPSNLAYANELLTLRDELTDEVNGIGSVAHFLFEYVEHYLPDAVIRDFYRLADALLVTSIDEGLGIPIMEAGFSRIPVFCSNILPFHETAGDLAHYFELNDSPEEIANRIAQRLKGDPLHQMRERMRDNYSWISIFEKQIEPLMA